MAGIAGLIAIAVGVAASLHTSAASKGPIRVGLVLPRKPTPGQEDVYVSPYVDGLDAVKRQFHFRATTIVAPDFNPPPGALRRLDRAIRSGHFDLVLVAGSGASARYLIAQSSRFPDTRFAIIDYALGAAELKGRKNVTGLTFDDEKAGELAGYLAALMAPATPGKRRRISAIGSFRIPQVEALINGYEHGARRAVPAIHIRVDYSGSFQNEAKCERLANAQIDDRSGVVFAPAGTCGLGALSATGIRGVWGIGADADRSGFNNHVLASTIARFDRGVELAVGWYEQGSLPGAKEIMLRLDSGAVGIAGLNASVPPTIRRKVATFDAQLRAERTNP
jgi:basic membrane lipoprotein Med (substrate-binding protein (PBP1-ABC) superfamily)